MTEPIFFLAPLSKNIIDSIIDYSEEMDFNFSFIPSRRQIDYDGGYVNNWNTYEFNNYIRSKTNKILIERDHGGPGQ